MQEVLQLSQSPGFWFAAVVAWLVGKAMERLLARVPRLNSDWLFYANVAAAVAVPALIVTGYSVFTGQMVLDLIYSCMFAAVYVAMAAIPSKAFRVFLLLGPTSLAIAGGVALYRLGSPTPLTGALSLYPIAFQVCELIALPIYIRLIMRMTRHVSE